jgi:hypothetical protein
MQMMVYPTRLLKNHGLRENPTINQLPPWRRPVRHLMPAKRTLGKKKVIVRPSQFLPYKSNSYEGRSSMLPLLVDPIASFIQTELSILT